MASVRKNAKGTVTVTRRGAVKATPELAAAVATVSNMRAAIADLTVEEKAAKAVVLAATGERNRLILDEAGDVICEVQMIDRSTCTVDGFVEALAALYPAVWRVLMDTDPKAVEAAKAEATTTKPYPKVLPK